MATRIIPSVPFLITDYTQAEEDAFAIELAGKRLGWAYIYNTALSTPRIWNGTAFENTPVVPPTLITSTGTFTPVVTLVGGAGNTVPVYTTNTGRYIRVGNLVFIDIYLNGDGGAEGAGTGQVNIELPFLASSTHSPGRFFSGVSINNTAEIDLYGIVPASGNTIQLHKRGTTTVVTVVVQTVDITNFTGADQNNTTRQIRLKFFYEASA